MPLKWNTWTSEAEYMHDCLIPVRRYRHVLYFKGFACLTANSVLRISVVILLITKYFLFFKLLQKLLQKYW
jgi:hypothetical protein